MKIEKFLNLLKNAKEPLSATEAGKMLNTDRTNASRYLNTLYKKGLIEKKDGRPVLYYMKRDFFDKNINFKNIIGKDESLAISIKQAKAAILYPPNGLHTLILGQTGTGKSMFAECMYEYSKMENIIAKNAPFIRFNCADYSQTPQLLMSYIFGVKKGSYTGALEDREGLIAKANNGILFLDEIHRLSPQGQEMLFTFIDKGEYKKLGDTKKESANVLIIGATTENVKSYLLDTFVRRIPMIINLPTLKERTLKERFELIEYFFKEESYRLLKPINLCKNSLISYLLYDCDSNIGQLQKDIKLSCAKAFLNFKANEEEEIYIDENVIPIYINKGFLKYKDFKSQLDFINDSDKDVFTFNYEEDNNLNFIKEFNIDKNKEFYKSIEEKVDKLKSLGFEKEKINSLISNDIEISLKKYLNQVPRFFKREELRRIVDEKVLDLTEEILMYASNELSKIYSEKIYFALSIHIQECIKRIKNKKEIYHPHLKKIKTENKKEFMIAFKCASMIEEKFDIEIPIDEVGYITMFITSKEEEDNEENNIKILVAMHGKSTASSMVEVSNELMGVKYARALDMPLDIDSFQMYERIKNEIKKMGKMKGLLLLVDMGSLSSFGKILEDELNIKIKTVDMVSTPLIIEATRKGIMGRSLQDVYDSCMNFRKKGIDVFVKNKNKKNIIITACFTGDGASKKIKNYLINNLEDKNIIIENFNILNKNEFRENIDRIKKSYNLIAVITTVPMELEDVKTIWAAEVLKEDGVKKISHLIEKENDYISISKSLKNHLTKIDSKEAIEEILNILKNIEDTLGIDIDDDVRVGVIMHMAFLIESLLSNEEKNYESISIVKEYKYEKMVIKKSVEKLEKKYKISINDKEVYYLCRMLVENNSV
ncbi:sigma 54-interacting transcriptional regulator [Peptostreptococcaceae bacterium AGR-M142]